MTARHYNEAFSAEWEAVQRWETEGGKLRQQHDNIFGSIGEGYQRHLDQAVTMGSRLIIFASSNAS